MKQTAKSLVWTSSLLWIIIVSFLLITVYSALNLEVEIGEVDYNLMGEDLLVSLPFKIDNNGYLQISELTIMTSIRDCNGTLITLDKTFFPTISGGTHLESEHNIKISIEEMSSIDWNYLLFSDSNFDLYANVSLDFAYLMPIEMTINERIPWGAPFHNFSVNVSILSYNSTHYEIVTYLSFENHTFLDITGTMQLEIYNNLNEWIVSGKTSLEVQSGFRFEGQVLTFLDNADISNLTETGKIYVNFITPMFTMDWWSPYD